MGLLPSPDDMVAQPAPPTQRGRRATERLSRSGTTISLPIIYRSRIVSVFEPMFWMPSELLTSRRHESQHKRINGMTINVITAITESNQTGVSFMGRIRQYLTMPNVGLHS